MLCFRAESDGTYLVYFSGPLQDAASWAARGFPSRHQSLPDLRRVNNFKVFGESMSLSCILHISSSTIFDRVAHVRICGWPIDSVGQPVRNATRGTKCYKSRSS